jgi:mersacidin/lichenicidin family type 2 lantibiotic
MNTEQIVKSWKDEDYVHELSAAEQALLPESPAGLMELSDEDLLGVNGASLPTSVIVTIIVITLTPITL